MNNILVSERKRKGLSRKEVADELGCSEGVIGKWERGESSPNLIPDCIKLSHLYGCSVDYLAGLTPERVMKQSA